MDTLETLPESSPTTDLAEKEDSVGEEFGKLSEKLDNLGADMGELAKNKENAPPANRTTRAMKSNASISLRKIISLPEDLETTSENLPQWAKHRGT